MTCGKPTSRNFEARRGFVKETADLQCQVLKYEGEKVMRVCWLEEQKREDARKVANGGPLGRRLLLSDSSLSFLRTLRSRFPCTR